jgi:AraC-like DNA-binding protein/quercetin dioxygenase-like cupin family protein
MIERPGLAVRRDHAKIRREMDRRSLDPADYQDLPRPVAVMAKDFPAGATVPWHRHKRAQLAFAAAGVMVMRTREGDFVVPPHRALWLPPGTEHSLRASTALRMRTLYVAPEAAGLLPPEVRVIDVSPLLRELILAAAALPPLWDEAGRDGRIMALMLDEIRALPVLPLGLPRPRDQRLVRLCGAITAAPGAAWTLERGAAEVGASARTLARLFEKELAMSFAAWLRRARLLAALERLARGDSVTAVALDCGYGSPSAFAQMFRRHIGGAPSRYFGKRR